MWKLLLIALFVGVIGRPGLAATEDDDFTRRWSPPYAEDHQQQYRHDRDWDRDWGRRQWWSPYYGPRFDWWRPWHDYRPRYGDYGCGSGRLLSPRELYWRLQNHGYSRFHDFERRGDEYRLRAIAPNGRHVRLFLDPRCGRILDRRYQ